MFPGSPRDPCSLCAWVNPEKWKPVPTQDNTLKRPYRDTAQSQKNRVYLLNLFLVLIATIEWPLIYLHLYHVSGCIYQVLTLMNSIS